MLKIQNDRLVGDGVSFHATPNVGAVMRPRYLIMHYTAGWSADSAVQSLCTRKAQGNTSAHIVLGRDGRIVQLAPLNVITWHAGVSQWNGLVGLNAWSIGIEMDNAGLLHREGSKYAAWFGKEYPESEVVLAAHKHGGGVQPWHAFSDVQIGRALELADLIVAHYGLEDVLGHEDIAPGRKTDPGPAFPLASIASRVMGRAHDSLPQYVVTATALNIRKGPDASFDTVAPKLKKGTIVRMLEPGSRWSKVEVVGPTDIEGWVNNDFITQIAAAPRSRSTLTSSPKPRVARAKTKVPKATRMSPRKR